MTFFVSINSICYIVSWFIFLEYKAPIWIINYAFATTDWSELMLTTKYLSGGFSLGWPVAGMGSVTDPDQFGMFGTLDLYADLWILTLQGNE